MKVCPSCQSRFAGGEQFCAHDGTKLVDARELSPGELTGSRLDDVVRLDRLAYSDMFAERYTGRLLESRRAVYVTVFNQRFKVDPGATRRVETARAKVGSPLPPQLNTLLQTHFDRDVPFLIESEPRAPSLRTLLDERRALSWEEAVRITANLARAMQWLHEHGVPHCSFHPTSIFVSNLQRGEVIVGDWALEALFPPESAERLIEEAPSAFAGYLDYMAPEIARGTASEDIRSAVYALGCLLYEMVLGRVPLPAANASDILKRHQIEKPVRLTIALDDVQVPPELDDILEVMLAKDPNKRFQSPGAALAALSNLVSDTPDELAPQLERAQETDVDDLYRTIDMASVDRLELETAGERVVGRDDAPDDEATTQPTTPLATVLKPRAGAVVGESSTDDTKTTTELEAVPSEVAEDSPKATLMSFGPAPADLDDEREASIEVAGATEQLFTTAEQEAVTDKQEVVTAQTEEPAKTDEPEKTEEPKKTAEPEAEPAASAPAAVQTPASREAVTPVDAPAAAAAATPAAATAAPTSTAAPKPERVKQKPSRVQDNTREIDRSSWFQGNPDEIWENSLVREAHETSERRNRLLTIVIVAGVLLGAVITMVVILQSGEPEEIGTRKVANQVAEPAVTTPARLAQPVEKPVVNATPEPQVAPTEPEPAEPAEPAEPVAQVEEPTPNVPEPEVAPQPVAAAHPTPSEKSAPKTATTTPKTATPKSSAPDARALVASAEAAHSAGDRAKARKLYEDALRAEPHNAVILAGLGKVLFDDGRYHDAAMHQTKAVRYAPSNDAYRVALGQSYYRLAKYQEALDVWEKVLERDPNNARARQYVELAKRKIN